MNSYRSLLNRSRGAHLVQASLPKVISERTGLNPEDLKSWKPDTIPFPGLRHSRFGDDRYGSSVSLRAFLHLLWVLSLITVILSVSSIFNSGLLF